MTTEFPAKARAGLDWRRGAKTAYIMPGSPSVIAVLLESKNHSFGWIASRDHCLKSIGFYQLISGYCVNVYDRKVELFLDTSGNRYV